MASEFPSRSFFDVVYQGDAPWDIGAPQPDLMQLIDEFPPDGRILDLGCGTGDLALGLAQAGHHVLGIDFVEAAVEIAKSRVGEQPAEVRARLEFRVGDALRPSTWTSQVRSVVDSGFYHLFDRSVRAEIADELTRTLPVGGRYYMLGFAVALPSPDVPRQVTFEELEELFAAETGWRIRALRAASFRTRGFDDVPAVALCAERVAALPTVHVNPGATRS